MWCTALSTTSTDPSAQQLILYLFFGFMIGFFLAFKSYSVMHCVHPTSPSLYTVFLRCFYIMKAGLVTLDLLHALRLMIFGWFVYILRCGIGPVDHLLEYYLTGGRTLYTTVFSATDVISSTLASCGKALFTFVMTHFAVTHDFLLDLFTWNNIGLLAPLLWMILLYISIYFKRRLAMNDFSTCFINKFKVDPALNNPNTRTRKHKFTYHKYPTSWQKMNNAKA